jgi:copper type II ascorbate-dependent monooxygenase-like protein
MWNPIFAFPSEKHMRPRASLAAACLILLATLAATVRADQYRRETTDAPTFSKDVAPILFKNCVGCHRPGEIAPMSLLTYQDARPWAKAIRDEVSEGHMPPWHADAPKGTFHNERGLTDAERDTLVRWANGGARRGDPKDLPPAPTFAEGWQIGKPDAVFEMLEDYKVPAEGTIQYEYFYIPTNFSEPKYVKAIEVRPGNREVVHHVLVYYRAKPDMPRTPAIKMNPEPRFPEETPGVHERPARKDLPPRRILATYAPGTNPQVVPAGTAIRLEPGGVLELQMHYTTTGEPANDRTKVGMIFAKDPSPREIRPSHFMNTAFTIPAGAADTSVDAEVEFLQDATVWGIFPHTHLRGKKWEYKLVQPDGSSRPILSVPRYDFNWQTYYMFKEPLQITKGSKIISTAWYDNSAANKSNPDPKVDVKWGDQTWEEMQYTGLLFSPVQTATTTTAEKQ